MQYKTKVIEVFRFLNHIRFKRIEKNKNILIYGISRGGTTLLAETLVGLFNARLVWEPLFPFSDVRFDAINPFSINAYKKLGFGWSPHTNIANVSKLNTYFDRLFSLKVRNIRYLRFTNHKEFENSDHTVFKFCFANFMYPYFQERYKAKAIILLRHPFAIAASSLNFGDNFNWHKENYASWKYHDSQHSGKFFEGYDDKYELINSPFTLLVFQAVSQFAYAMENMDASNTIVVYYEDIVAQPEHVFEQLEHFFEIPLDESIFTRLVKKQSFSSQKGHTKKNPLDQLSKWKTKVPKEEIASALKIFEAFEFECYSDEILPLKHSTSSSIE
ncbi:sulfotransferase [Subsaximicrobium wynnwilliamsii]|uniref:Sulfotransferase n=1 Tax=Subsaximicrobium wynnwilliamsii TaxID=291179 RepID=A0A5C6ZG56_9FLAO|nr:sulfotransferase domain-containing protein [Subsaximicrobium wynnwilliamsii]TXD81366.1 sulfotransferase [Subsaximicrobium wynnwilliamsii]TXD89062.1 sulfotransferase [Subsaximicrobium wynnwilliamsii]TXE00740.1 sulfotransferase [Subsaximicrobium wynnwilliamsii]